MAFLTKIRNLIKQYQNRNFRATVTKEKGKKYLFRDTTPENTRGKWNIFKKNGERTSAFSRFIQDKIHITEDLKKKQEYTLRYIGIFLIGLCVYIVGYSPYFQLSPSKILIEWLDDGIDVSIAYRSIEDLYGKNIFLLDEQEIALSLKKYQKNISLIQIDRLYPNNLKILLSGYPIIFDIKISNIVERQWGMTENGVLIPRDTLEATPLYILEYIDSSLTNDDLLDYRELIAENDSQIIKRTIDSFSDTWPDLPLEKSYYLRKENELHLLLQNKTRIIFTLQDFTKRSGEPKSYSHVRLQLLGLKAFLDKNKATLSAGWYVYVDARIPGKIFSCREKELCAKNITAVYPDLVP